MPYKTFSYDCLGCGKVVNTKNKGGTNTCKSCNALRNLEKIHANGNISRRLRPFEYAYNSLVRNAKKMKREVTISYDDYLAFTNVKKCHYCAKPINWKPFTDFERKDSNYYLDRKDNNVPYTMENLVTCCPKCNRIKSNEFSYVEFVQLISFIKKMREEE